MAEVPIWIVNADHWPRAFLCAELIERGYDATGFETIEDAVARLRLTRARRPLLLVLDRRDQIVDERMTASLARAGIPVLAVVDAARSGDGHAAPVVEVLHRPVTIGSVADAVERIVRDVSRPSP